MLEKGDEETENGIVQYRYDALNRRVSKVIKEIDIKNLEEDIDKPFGEQYLFEKYIENNMESFTEKEVVDYHLYGANVVEEIHSRSDESDTKKWMLSIKHLPYTIDRYLGWDIYIENNDDWKYQSSYYPIVDIRNNIIAAVNTDGKIEAKVEYDPYGNGVICTPKSKDNSSEWNCLEETDGSECSEGILNEILPYRFAGRRYEKETGMYYYRNRYYSPEMGRFISIDDGGIWSDLDNYGNGYAYVGNRENLSVDPYGRDDVDVDEMRQAFCQMMEEAVNQSGGNGTGVAIVTEFVLKVWQGTAEVLVELLNDAIDAADYVIRKTSEKINRWKTEHERLLKEEFDARKNAENKESLADKAERAWKKKQAEADEAKDKGKKKKAKRKQKAADELKKQAEKKRADAKKAREEADKKRKKRRDHGGGGLMPAPDSPDDPMELVKNRRDSSGSSYGIKEITEQGAARMLKTEANIWTKIHPIVSNIRKNQNSLAISEEDICPKDIKVEGSSSSWFDVDDMPWNPGYIDPIPHN